MKARHRVSRIIASTIAVFAILSTSRFARSEVVTLQSLETRAVARRATISVARAGTAGARAGVSLAQSESQPKLGVNLEGDVASGGQLVEVVDASGNRYLVQGSRALGESGSFTPQVRYGASLSLDSPIYDFGRSRAVEDAASARVAAGSAGERAARAGVIRDVRRAYLAWIAAFSGYTLVKEDLEAARERRRSLEDAVRDGLEPPSNLATIRYEEALTELEASRARARLLSARIDVGRSTGEALPASAEPDVTLLDSKLRAADSAPRTPELEALRTQLAAASAVVRARQAEDRPIFGASMEGGVRGQNNRFFPAYRAGVSLLLPIWDGGVSAARSSLARAEANEIAARAKGYRTALDIEMQRARADIVSATERLALAENLVRNAQARLEAAEERHRMGEVAPDVVAQARADLRRAEYEVVLSKVSRMDAAFRLADPGANVPHE